MIKLDMPYITAGYCSVCKSAQSGTLISDQSTVMFCGKMACRQGDIAKANCGHTGIVMSGITTILTVGRATVFLGSTFAGTYTGVVTGAPIG